MKRYIIFIILLLFGLWLGVRACSDGNGSRKLFYIGRDSTWAPDGFLGKERNMVGFTNEMMGEISRRENMRFEFVGTNTNELLPALDRGDVDAIFSTLTSDVVNEDRYLFSDIFYPLGPVLVVRESSPVKSMEDLSGKIVGVQIGALQTYQIYEFPNLIIIPYNNILKAIEDLDKNAIDGVILDALHANAYVQSYYAGRLKIATPPLTERGWRIVARLNPASSHLIESFNDGLKKMKEDGSYDKLIQKWDLFPSKSAT